LNLSCDLIEHRSSCRIFDNQRIVTQENIHKLIYAASLAPSGKNSQPWKFHTIDHIDIKKISEILPHNKWISHVKQAIAVYLDQTLGYDIEKNAMAIGACIENMLIEAEKNGIATCWIGECIDFRNDIHKLFNITPQYSLMSIVMIGYCKHRFKKVTKHLVNELLIK
jgi:nitroreductase